MADRPVLFSTPMVVALLEGRKTQTRRLIKPRGHASLFNNGWSDSYILDPGNASWRAEELRFAIGDRLWVKETWKPHSIYADRKPSEIPPSKIFFRADDTYAPSNIKWWPSLFMPRWASRTTLLVADVRVERLQGISEADALAEGIERIQYPEIGDWGWPQQKYKELWNHINGVGTWEANPWVVAVTFEVLKQNIDEVA